LYACGLCFRCFPPCKLKPAVEMAEQRGILSEFCS